MTRFSALSLLAKSLNAHRDWPEQWPDAAPKPHYDAIIVGGGGHDGFADGVVNSALRFRAQAPLVDQLLREIGLDAGDLGRLTAGATSTQALPPVSPKAAPAAKE